MDKNYRGNASQFFIAGELCRRGYSAVANRLIKLALDEKIKGYAAVSAIQTAFSILQSGITDRENKTELRKLRDAMERIEGEPSGIVDIE